MKQSGSCRCGASKFLVNGESLGRFFCHCTICQSAYKRPFADITAFRARDVELAVDNKVRFKRLRPPPAVNRAFCAQCNLPVVGFLSSAPGLGLGLVPSGNLPDQGELPDPFVHIFYERRVADVADAIPKVNGYWRSEWIVGRRLVAAMLGLGRA